MSRPVGLALQSGSDDSVRGFQILVLIEETRDYSVDSKRRQDYSPRAEPHASGTQEGVGQPLLTAVVVQEYHSDGGCRQAHDAPRSPLLDQLFLVLYRLGLAHLSSLKTQWKKVPLGPRFGFPKVVFRFQTVSWSSSEGRV